MTNLEPKYTLFDSLDQMLAPETLSELLFKPVTRVDIQPMMDHGGATGAQLSRVYTDTGHFVLKQMSMETDFAMCYQRPSLSVRHTLAVWAARSTTALSGT